jgi:hypothetical protein
MSEGGALGAKLARQGGSYPRSRRDRFVVLVGVVTLVIGGCSDGEPPTSSADGEAPTTVGDYNEPQEVTIVATDYEYADAPTELEGGVINLTFENQGAVPHEVALAGIGDTPVDRFVEDLDGGTGLEGNPFPDYLDQVAVPPFVSAEGGATREGTFTLSEGRYALFCSIRDVAKGDKRAPHYELGMIRELTVSGGDAEPQLPEADSTIIATDYAFDVDLDAGDSTVNFINEGPGQVHLTAIEMYPAGVDAEEAEAAFKAQLEPGPQPEGLPTADEGLGFTGVFSGGLGSRFQLDGEFESGRTYLFACWIADRVGGKPHALAYDMYKVLTIE